MTIIKQVVTKERIEMVDITSLVRSVVKSSPIKDGAVIVYSPHTTAGITINENSDPSVKRDILEKLNQLVPYRDNYSHLEGNADAHIKASLIGSSVIVPVKDKELLFGTWQGIFFCEFDGPRNRKIIIQLLD